MLVLSRKAGEQIILDGCVRVKVVSIKGNTVRIGIDAPREVAVNRSEVHERYREFAEKLLAAEEQPVP